MKLSLKTTWLILMVLVLAMACTSVYFKSYTYFTSIIFLLSALKFCFVAFQFMEMKNANPLWKVILSLFALIISVVMVVGISK